MATVTVGMVLAAHGVKGAFRCESRTDSPGRLASRARYILHDPRSNEIITLTLREVSLQPTGFIIRFDELTVREFVSMLRGWLLEIAPERVPGDTAGDEYYHFQLAGLSVVAADGRRLGTVVNVLPGTAHGILEYEDDAGRRHLISFVRSMIAEVDLAAGCIRLQPLAERADV